MPPRRRGRNAVISSESEPESEIESLSEESHSEEEINHTQRGRNVRARTRDRVHSPVPLESPAFNDPSLMRELTIFEESIKASIADAYELGLDLADAGMINQVRLDSVNRQL